MASPLDHYPAEADFAALWQDIRAHFRERRACRLQHAVALKLQTSEQMIARANEASFGLKIHGRFYRMCAKDRLSMLDTWCREAQELLGDCGTLLNRQLSRATHTELENAWYTLAVEIVLAASARSELKGALTS